MLGFFLIFATFGTFNFTELSELIPQYGNEALVALMGILVFIGPIGKSAQFPLHVCCQTPWKVLHQSVR